MNPYDCSVLFLQGSNIAKHTVNMPKPTQMQQKSAAELLARAILRGNIPPVFLQCTEFRRYTQVISGGNFSAISRPCFYNILKDLEKDARRLIQSNFTSKPFISVEEDSWSSGNRKFSAITGGGYSHSFFMDCITAAESQDAVTSAQHISQCLLQCLGLDTSLPRDHPSIPAGKVANLTTDTANVMPATARELRKYKLFTGLTWTPCSCHVLNLFLLNQVEKCSQVKSCIASGRVIVDVFSTGGVHKIFARYASNSPIVCCYLQLCSHALLKHSIFQPGCLMQAHQR